MQVDLIDFQSQPDGEYKFILVYQDHLTKFVVLRALKSKTADEVCENIIDIFTLLGAPTVLQSDNGREFVNKIINGLVDFWPNFKIVHGKPRHSQSQGSVERANQDVENMLTIWMHDHKSSNWSYGLKFIQLMKNSALHSGIKRTPYEAMFGCPPKHGLATSSIPTEALTNVESEEDLEAVIRDITVSGEHDTGENIQETSSTLENEGDLSVTENSEDQHLEGTSYLLTDLDKSTMDIKRQRDEAFKCLTDQAKRMKSTSDHKLQPVDKGCTVRVPVPDVDRGRGDARSILGVVLDVVDNGFYRIGTRDGVLKQLYARSQFNTCPVNIIKEDEIPMEKTLTLRTVATTQSTGSGQGFFKCSCNKKCQTKKCYCIKNNVLCNSKCHKALSCCNK
ncbi:KRAB-A domain-containing protein 2-like [Diabrotica virgifera virgifera]|uniref:Integrase catalytic domain-containing protein n=1 Tax=Diabrotica virgifera virgifera TaxID=50390 RepID=A0ABM5JPT6_DIAVI|nr:KRAB-A domain-containing protein 2-like [Diabrotica virgifera virgifera]